MQPINPSPWLRPDEQRVFWRLWVTFCLLYVFELANFNITIDDEFLAQAGVCHFAEIGRWVHPLLRATLWPQPVVPTGPLLLFGAALSISFVWVARLLRVPRFQVFHYLVFAAYALYPSWIAQLEFAANVLPAGIGVVAATYAALLTVADAGGRTARPDWRRWALAVLACAVAIGSYQSLALMTLTWVAGAALALRQHQTQAGWKPQTRLGLRALAVVATAAAASFAISRLVMWGCGTAASEYGSGIMHFQDALLRPWNALSIAVNEVRRLYFSFWRPFGLAGAVYLVTVAVCVTLIVRRPGAGARGKTGLAVALLLLVPAGISLVGANTMAIRTFFAAAAVLACLMLLAHSSTASRRWQLVLAALVGLCAVQGLYINSVQQARGWQVARHDQALAAAVHAAIVRQHGVDDGSPIPVTFQGMRVFRSRYPMIRTTSVGASFFEWDGGDPWRMVAYMNQIGYANLRVHTERRPGEFAAVFAQMPNWPAEGSVRRVGAGYLVKLSEPQQVRPAQAGGLITDEPQLPAQ